MNDEATGGRLRTALTSRQRQAIINDRERGWMKALQTLGVNAGHHPFLDAGNSEVIEARFFEYLRRGVPFERSLTKPELTAVREALSSLPIDRLIIVFSPNPGVLGAFMADSSRVLPRLDVLAAHCGLELAIMAVDAEHGLSLERSNYAETGELVPDGVILMRAWGDFAPADLN
jgi:hypothetical protein